MDGRLAFLAKGDFLARSLFARSAISEATKNVHAIYLATLLENEMRSDVAVLPPK